MERGENTEREGETTEGEIAEREGENTEREEVNTEIENAERGGENTEIEEENTERENEEDIIWMNSVREYLEGRKTGKNKDEKEDRERRERERKKRERETEREGGVGKRIEAERKKWENRTEEWLCDAAMRGDVESLNEIIEIDDYILDKVLVGSFKGKNPLHLAVSTGQKEFVLELLSKKEDLVKTFDAELGSALHIASSKGYLEIAKLLVKVSPGMCLALDREGNNPLHIAAMQGKVEVLKVLLQVSPHAARVKVDRGDSILHLCVNYNRFESLQLLLEMVQDKEFVNSTDTNGNNILHLAVFGKRVEIIKYVLCKSKIEVNARNGSEWTAMDIYYRVNKDEDWIEGPWQRYVSRAAEVLGENISSEFSFKTLWNSFVILWKLSIGKANRIRNPTTATEYDSIKDILREAKARRREKLYIPLEASWQKKKKETLMIVSSLFATIAFTVGVNPPGGVWQDNSRSGDPLPHHVAGKAITATHYPIAYKYFMYFNTVGFLLSLTTILELIVALPSKYKFMKIIRSMISWMTIMTTAFTYTFSVNVISPTENYEKSVSHAILVTVSVWAAVITYFRLLPYRVHMIVAFVVWCIYAVSITLVFGLVPLAIILLVLVGVSVGISVGISVGLAIMPVGFVVILVAGIVGLIRLVWLWIRSKIQFRKEKAKKTSVPSELPT